MPKVSWLSKIDPILTLVSALLVLLSVLILRSITPSLFPQYFVFIFLGILFFWIFLQIDFEILLAFSPHLYVLSIILLVLPLLIGQVTRGAIRWVPIGGLTIQPSEIVRPFLLLFFANYLIKEELDVKRLIIAFLLFFTPAALILIQPSLGVMILTSVGFFGIVLASTFKKRYILMGIGAFVLLIPLIWLILAPYQKQRLSAFVNPYLDPSGAGYNSIQSMISVGSGKLIGRGLGKGVQTQLAFLPEKHTDFIFAATSEELGFVGASLLLIGIFLFLYRIIKASENSKGPIERAFISGVFLALFAESIIHIGMNLGLLPITGVPLPLVSAGGSAFLATMISLAMIMNARNIN